MCVVSFQIATVCSPGNVHCQANNLELVVKPVIGMLLLVLLLPTACKMKTGTETVPAPAMVATSPRPATPLRTTSLLRLPASYRGTISCADCRGTDTYLELRSDHSYMLEQRFLGRSGISSQRIYTMGHFSQNGDLLRLEAKTEPPRLFRIHTPEQLKLLDSQGKPDGHNVLSSSDQQLLPTGNLILRGHYVFSDDQGFFRECETNHSWPVATAGDSDALEAQYQALSAGPNAIVFARLQAHIANQPNATGDGSEEVLVVDHVISLNISEDCKVTPP